MTRKNSRSTYISAPLSAIQKANKAQTATEALNAAYNCHLKNTAHPVWATLHLPIDAISVVNLDLPTNVEVNVQEGYIQLNVQASNENAARKCLATLLTEVRLKTSAHSKRNRYLREVSAMLNTYLPKTSIFSSLFSLVFLVYNPVTMSWDGTLSPEEVILNNRPQVVYTIFDIFLDTLNVGSQEHREAYNYTSGERSAQDVKNAILNSMQKSFNARED